MKNGRHCIMLAAPLFVILSALISAQAVQRDPRFALRMRALRQNLAASAVAEYLGSE
jgi:hypothetical protein